MVRSLVVSSISLQEQCRYRATGRGLRVVFPDVIETMVTEKVLVESFEHASSFERALSTGKAVVDGAAGHPNLESQTFAPIILVVAGEGHLEAFSLSLSLGKVLPVVTQFSPCAPKIVPQFAVELHSLVLMVASWVAWHRGDNTPIEVCGQGGSTTFIPLTEIREM
eukprot:2226257-Amphidinium_carterae.1